MKQSQHLLSTCLFAIMLSFLAFSGVAKADDNVPCGMVATDEGYKIESGNTDICSEDLAFQGTYLLFADVLKSPILREYILLFVDESTLDSPFTEFADENINVSHGIYFLLSAISIFSWSILTPIIGIKGYKYVVMVKRTGNLEFSESRGDTVKFVSYTTFLMVLIMPVGLTGGRDGEKFPLMVGQTLAIIASLPAHMGGNYVYSTYLSSTEMASSDVPLKEDFLLPSGQNISNGFVEGQLCQMRTRQAVLAANGKAGSSFFENKWIGESLFGLDQEDVLERIDNCLGYAGVGEEGISEATIDSLSINKFNPRATTCSSNNTGLYDPEMYGYNHTCTSIDFAISDGKFTPTLETDEENGKSMEDQIETIHDKYKASYAYSQFRSATKFKIQQILQYKDLNATEKYNALNQLFMTDGKVVIDNLFKDDPIFSTGNNDQKQVKYMALSTALFGGTIDKSDWGQVLQNGLVAMFVHSRDYSGLGNIDDKVFGVDTFINEANQIAKLIQRYQCAIDWKEHKETRLFIANFNAAGSQEEIESLFSRDDVKMECVEFLPESIRVDTDLGRYVRYQSMDVKSMDDIYKSDEGIWLPKNMTNDEYIELSIYMEQEVSRRFYNEIKLRQMMLTGYTVAVKKAVAEGLSKELSQRQAENDFDGNLRPMGWGAMGGALLYLGKNQSGAMHMASSIDDAITVEVGALDTRYISTNAFGPDPDKNAQDTINRLFSPMEVSEFFTIGESGLNEYRGPSGITSDENEAALGVQFMRMLESIFFSPTVHIKSASGMNTEGTLSEGFMECFDSGYDKCLSGTKHPVIALSNFGNELMNNMLTLMTVDAVLRAVNRLAFYSGSAESTTVTNSERQRSGYKKWKDKVASIAKDIGSTVAKVVGGVVGVIIKVIGAISVFATVVMDTIYPLVITLFVAGAMFAYIIPMMSYLFGLMMLFLCLVGFFLGAIVLPLYLITKFLHIEKEYENGFRKFYEDFLGPYLTPMFFTISAALAWNMIVIVLFVLNSTFTLIYQGLGSSASNGVGLASFFFEIFMYVVYLVAVFVLFRFALGIMKDLPDMMKEKLSLKKGNDAAYIDSLSFEQYVNARIMSDIATLPTNLAKGLAAYRAAGGMTADEAKKAADQAEEFAALIDKHGGEQEFSRKLSAMNEMASAENSSNANNNANDNAPAPTSENPAPNLEVPNDNAEEGGDSSSESTKDNGKKKATLEVEEGTGFAGDLNGDRQDEFEAKKARENKRDES